MRRGSMGMGLGRFIETALSGLHGASFGANQPGAISRAFNSWQARLAQSWVGTAWNRLSLANQFTLVAAVIVGIAMAVMGTWISQRIKESVIRHAAIESAFHVANFVEPHVQEVLPDQSISDQSRETLKGLFGGTALSERIANVKLWGRGGRVMFSSHPEQIGKTYPVTPRLKSAWAGNVQSQLEGLDDDEHELEKSLHAPLIEVYTPIYKAKTGEVIAVLEFYERADELVREMVTAQEQSWLVVAASFCAMLIALFAVVRQGSQLIVMQKQTLINQIQDLSQLLKQNEELQSRLRTAHKRTAENNDMFLRRLGSELHDGPAQLIGLSLLRLDSVPGPDGKPHPRNASEPIETIRHALQDALTEIRSISAGLNLPELEGRGLPEVIRLAVGTHERRTGDRVTITTEGDLAGDCPLAVKTCLYRATQEGLNNAFRHAKEAPHSVRLKQTAEAIQLEIADEGPGFDPDAAMKTKDRLGLVGLRDRVQSLGGRFDLASSPGRGAKLIITFILPETGVF